MVDQSAQTKAMPVVVRPVKQVLHEQEQRIYAQTSQCRARNHACPRAVYAGMSGQEKRGILLMLTTACAVEGRRKDPRK